MAKVKHQKMTIEKLARPHFKNIFGRDTGQFCVAQGATTKVYVNTPRRSDKVSRKIGRIPSGCGYVLAPRRCGFVAVAWATASSPRLADARTSLATRPEDIFEMGSMSQREFVSISDRFDKVDGRFDTMHEYMGILRRDMEVGFSSIGEVLKLMRGDLKEIKGGVFTAN